MHLPLSNLVYMYSSTMHLMLFFYLAFQTSRGDQIKISSDIYLHLQFSCFSRVAMQVFLLGYVCSGFTLFFRFLGKCLSCHICKLYVHTGSCTWWDKFPVTYAPSFHQLVLSDESVMIGMGGRMKLAFEHDVLTFCGLVEWLMKSQDKCLKKKMSIFRADFVTASNKNICTSDDIWETFFTSATWFTSAEIFDGFGTCLSSICPSKDLVCQYKIHQNRHHHHNFVTTT